MAGGRIAAEMTDFWYGNWQIASLMWVRAGVFAALFIHLAVRRHLQLAAPPPPAAVGGRTLPLLAARLVLGACATLFSVVISYKLLYQPFSKQLGWSTACLGAGSELHTCLYSFDGGEECATSTSLSWTVGGGELRLGYSYEDEFWSFRDYGPTRAECERP